MLNTGLNSSAMIRCKRSGPKDFNRIAKNFLKQSKSQSFEINAIKIMCYFWAKDCSFWSDLNISVLNDPIAKHMFLATFYAFLNKLKGEPKRLTNLMKPKRD